MTDNMNDTSGKHDNPGKLERILISDDLDDALGSSDESARLPDPYMSPPCLTHGSLKTYIALAVATFALATAATIAWHYCKSEPAKAPARYIPRD